MDENEPMVEVYKKLLAKRQASMKMSGVVEVYKKLVAKWKAYMKMSRLLKFTRSY